MNYRMLANFFGQILRIGGLLMCIPLIVALIYGESHTYIAFIIPIVLQLVGGSLLVRLIPKNSSMFAQEGFVCVALTWVLLSAVGALPFFLSGSIPNYMDAFFETVSGFTTTGATVLTNIEAMPKGILFWRSLTHWIGGMGILVFVLMFLPKAQAKKTSMMHVMRAEMPGPSVGKISPKAGDTARILYAMYIVLTAAEVILLLIGGMNLYEALIHAFSTAGTGGFSCLNASIAQQSAFLQYVITVFMFLFSINFNLYYFVILKKWKEALKSEELRVFAVIVAVSVAVITLDIHAQYDTLEHAFRAASFQTVSIVSTTGFVSENFDLWPVLSRVLMVVLMFIGACAGSTGGGMKVSRIMILIKDAVRDLGQLAHPRRVKSIRLEGKPVDEQIVNNASTYLQFYVILLVLSVILVAVFDEMDMVSTFTSVVTCLNNVGPGMGEIVGATGNFSTLSLGSKAVLSFCMLAGRLEVFPMLIIFFPSTWKRA